MDYKEMIEALNLNEHTETLLRIKDKILPEAWEQIEKHIEIGGEHENTSKKTSSCMADVVPGPDDPYSYSHKCYSTAGGNHKG